jgi:hypothetical protein
MSFEMEKIDCFVSRKYLYNSLKHVCSNPRVQKFLQKFRTHLQIRCTRRVLEASFHTGDAEILGPIVQNLDAVGVVAPGFVLPCLPAVSHGCEIGGRVTGGGVRDFFYRRLSKFLNTICDNGPKLNL